MADRSESSRRYTEKEIGFLFQRALQRQEVTSTLGATGGGRREGFSLEEVEQIAAEVGIDPAHIRAAAADLEAVGAQDRFYWLGGPERMVVEQVVEGELPEEGWERLVSELQRVFGVGERRREGSSFEWTCKMAEAPTQVRATPREGRTRLEFLSEWPTAALFFVPAIILSIFFAGFFGAFAPLAPWLKWVLAPLGIAAIFALTRSLYGLWVRRHQQRLRALVDRLFALAAREAQPEQQEKAHLKAEETGQESISRQQSLQ